MPTTAGATPVTTPGFAGSLTLGVEEEFLLLDAATGRVAPIAPDLIALIAGEQGVKPEFMRYQLEAATGVCTSLEQARAELLHLRRTAARAAARLGCRLVATGFAPMGLGAPALSDDPRYRLLADRFGGLLPHCGTCGCHVHVGMPSRDLGLRVLVRLRPWLATLLAVSANSPIARGRPARWDSERHRHWTAWPSVMPPEPWPDVAAYDAEVRRLVETGQVIDERGVYFHARLSPRYPTIEIRVMDTCLTVDDTILVVALVRALAATALAETAREAPVPVVPQARVKAALTHAARYGYAGGGIDPFTGRRADRRRLTDRLLAHLRDDGTIATLLAALAERGTGASRQRAMWNRSTGPDIFARLLAQATLSSGGKLP
jgi:carboxylate-amine ligase